MHKYVRSNTICCDIVSSKGHALPWVDSVRYLGVYLVRYRTFKCDFDNAKSSFYRAFNAVYGKIGRYGSEEVILQLIYSKCFPCLVYDRKSQRDTEDIRTEFNCTPTHWKTEAEVTNNKLCRS